MPKRRLPLLFACLLLGTASAATPTGSITVVDQFQPQTLSPDSPGKYRVQIGSTEGQPLTGVGFRVDLGSAFSQLSGFQSTCGGTVTWAGAVATFQGGTLPQAPSSSQPTLCDVTIEGTSVTLSGNKTIQLPAQAIVTDQNLTNANGSASTLTVTPLQKLRLQQGNFQYRDGVNLRYDDPAYPVNSNTTVMHQTAVINDNDRPITGIDFTDTPRFASMVKAVHPRPDLTKCTGPGAPGGSFSTSGSSYSYQGLNLPARSQCLFYAVVEYRGLPDTVGYYELSPTQPQHQTPSRDDNDLRITHNDQDPALNTALQISAPRYLGFAVVKNFEGQRTYNIRGGNGTTLTMNVLVSNQTLYDGTYTLSDVLPAPLKGVSAAVDIRAAGQASACSSSGVSFDPNAGILTLRDAPIPARTVCTYSVTLHKPDSLPVPEGWSLESPIYTRSIGQSNATDTLTPDDAYGNVVAAIAYLNDTALLAGGKRRTSGQQRGYNWYAIDLTSRASFAVTGIDFTDRWTHNLRVSAQTLTRQCGGTLTLDEDRRGFHFSGGSVPAQQTCTLYIDIDPASALAGEYPNTTSDITTDNAGTLPPLSGSLTIAGTEHVSGDFRTLYQDIPGIVSFTNQSFSAFPTTKTFSTPLPPGLRLDTSRPVSTFCTYVNSDYDFTNLTLRDLDSHQVEVRNNTLFVTDTVPAARLGKSGPLRYGNSGSNEYANCSYLLPVTSSVPGSQTSPATVTVDGVALPLSHDNGSEGLLLNYTTEPAQDYRVNLAFSPQTVVAGQETFLSLSITGGTNDAWTPRHGQITNRLPDGMLVSRSAFAPNQPDGRYVSPDTVPLFIPGATIGLPCLEINAARDTFIQRCRADDAANDPWAAQYNRIPIRVVKYGDLIDTVQPGDVVAFYGQVTGPASASAKSTRGVPIEKTFSPTTIKSGESTTLSVRVDNAQPEFSGDNVIQFTDPLPRGLSAAEGPLPVGGDCAGAQASYEAGSQQLRFSGISLAPNSGCTVTVALTGTNASPAATTLNNTIPANAVTSTVGGTNVQPTSAGVTILPAPAQPGLTKTQSLCGAASTPDWCEDGSFQVADVQLKLCQKIAYRIEARNNGGLPLRQSVIEDRWPPYLTFLGASAGSGNVLWQIGSGPLLRDAPAAGALQSGQTLRAGLDSNGDGRLDSADGIGGGDTFSVTLLGQLPGPGCR